MILVRSGESWDDYDPWELPVAPPTRRRPPQPAERTQRSSDSTGHLFVLLFFFLFSFLLRRKLGLFLLFLFAFVSFPLITHIRFSLLEHICSATSPSRLIVIVPISNSRMPDRLDPGPGTEQRPSLTRIQPIASRCLVRGADGNRGPPTLEPVFLEIDLNTEPHPLGVPARTKYLTL